MQRNKWHDSQHCLVFYPAFVVGHLFSAWKMKQQLAIDFFLLWEQNLLFYIEFNECQTCATGKQYQEAMNQTQVV